MELEDELYETIFELRQKVYDLEDENESLKYEIHQLEKEKEHILQDREENYIYRSHGDYTGDRYDDRFL